MHGHLSPWIKMVSLKLNRSCCWLYLQVKIFTKVHWNLVLYQRKAIWFYYILPRKKTNNFLFQAFIISINTLQTGKNCIHIKKKKNIFPYLSWSSEDFEINKEKGLLIKTQCPLLQLWFKLVNLDLINSIW